MKSISTIIIVLFSVASCMAQIKRYETNYKNGPIQSVKHQGTFMGCGVPVGVDSIFNRKGKLMETTEYIHLKDQKEQDCHAIMTYVRKISYKPGRFKPDVRYYKSGYESELVGCDIKEFKNAKERSRKK